MVGAVDLEILGNRNGLDVRAGLSESAAFKTGEAEAGSCLSSEGGCEGTLVVVVA